MQKDAFNHCEHRSVCADSQGQGNGGEQREPGAAAQIIINLNLGRQRVVEKKKAALASLPIQISTG